MSELETLLDEDINLLIKHLTHPEKIDRAALRVSASTIARRWIVDRQLATLGHELGLVPTLPAIATDAHTKIIQRDSKCRFYSAGGAGVSGLPINSLYAHAHDRIDDSVSRLPVPGMKQYTLSKFRARKSVFFSGHFLSVEEVVRFVANKTGGAHFDSKRDKFVDQKAVSVASAPWYRIFR